MGWVRIIIGVIGLIVVYSMRPPSDMGEAFSMMGQGRNFYLKEPIYLALMAASGLIALWGLVDVVRLRGSQTSTNSVSADASKTNANSEMGTAAPATEQSPAEPLVSQVQQSEQSNPEAKHSDNVAAALVMVGIAFVALFVVIIVVANTAGSSRSAAQVVPASQVSAQPAPDPCAAAGNNPWGKLMVEGQNPGVNCNPRTPGGPPPCPAGARDVTDGMDAHFGQRRCLTDPRTGATIVTR